MSKKISVNAFEKAISENFDKTTTQEWNGLEIEVKRNLSVVEMMAFVDNVSKACFSDKDATYTPEMKDFAVRVAIIELYTNITLAQNIHKKYDVIYGSNILDTVLGCIDQTQFNAMMRAVEDKTSHLANANVEMINRQMNELYASFDNLQKKLSDLFEGIGEDDIKNIAGALANGAIDEEKIVKTFMESKNKE